MPYIAARVPYTQEDMTVYLGGLNQLRPWPDATHPLSLHAKISAGSVDDEGEASSLSVQLPNSYNAEYRIPISTQE